MSKTRRSAASRLCTGSIPLISSPWDFEMRKRWIATPFLAASFITVIGVAGLGILPSLREYRVTSAILAILIGHRVPRLDKFPGSIEHEHEFVRPHAIDRSPSGSTPHDLRNRLSYFLARSFSAT